MALIKKESNFHPIPFQFCEEQVFTLLLSFRQTLQRHQQLQECPLLGHLPLRSPLPQLLLLILSTKIDKLVSHPANLRAHERLPNSHLIEFGEEAHHEILREVDEVRARAMNEIAAFLDKVAPSQEQAN